MSNLIINGNSTDLTLFFVYYAISLLFSMGMTALFLVAHWHLVKKLGMPGWKGIIPFYGDYVIYKEVWETKPFWVLVISAGVYYVFSMISVVVLTVNMAIAANSGNTSHMPESFVVFTVVFSILTLIFLVLALVIQIRLNIRLAKEFGKGTGYALGLTLLPMVFYPVLAFGKAQRVGVPK